MKAAGTARNVSERKVAVIFSPANMFAKRRMVNDSGRAKWLINSMGTMSGARSRHGAGEVRQIPADALGSKTHPVVVEEHADGQTRGHGGRHGWRFETGNYSDQIHEQNENKQSAEERDVFAGAMIDGIVRLAGHEVIDRFKGELQLAWFVHRQARAQERKQEQDNRDYQDLEDDPVLPTGARGPPVDGRSTVRNDVSALPRYSLKSRVSQSCDSCSMDKFVDYFAGNRGAGQ